MRSHEAMEWAFDNRALAAKKILRLNGGGVFANARRISYLNEHGLKKLGSLPAK